MKIEFKNALSDIEKQNAQRLYQQLNDVSIFQLISFPALTSANNKLKYVLAINAEESLVGYCVMTEAHSNSLPFIKTAKIQYGPVCEKTEVEVSMLNEIYDYYKTLGYSSIEIQLRHLAGLESEKIVAEASKHFSFYHKYNKNNRCTIHIDLTKTIDEIQKDFANVLLKNIRSAINKNVKVRLAVLDEEIKEFASLYMKMGNKRGTIHYTETYLFDLCKFLIETQNGFLLCSFADEKMIGGGLFINQGDKTEYQIGATDPDFKKIPASHLVLFEAIKHAKETGRKIFDMGGIGFYATPADQIYNINQFKENFSKNYVFYTKVLYVDMKPFYLKLLKMLSFIKSRWS